MSQMTIFNQSEECIISAKHRGSYTTLKTIKSAPAVDLLLPKCSMAAESMTVRERGGLA